MMQISILDVKPLIKSIFSLIILVVTTNNCLNAETLYPLQYSQLPIELQRTIEKRVSPPPTAQREASYSTPMYYLMFKGYRDGIGSMDPNKTGNLVLDRNRPDWQEALIKDWTELGLVSTLYLTTPMDWEDPYVVQAIKDYFDLSRKYGMRVGIRLAGDEKIGGLEASGWDLHPNNPNNKLDEYIQWVKTVVKVGKGMVEYYILGDELDIARWEAPTGEAGKTEHFKAEQGKEWTPEVYMKVFPQLSKAIKEIDPQAKVTMFGMGNPNWDYVNGLFKNGYAKYADGVAVNIGGNDTTLQEFANNIRTVAPNFKFYSNGVGYLAAKDTNYYPTNYKGKSYTDEEQAILIAKTMFRCFEAGWDETPYYIIVRQWVLPDGSFAPHWYGLFGFADLIIDKYSNLSVIRYPGWYTFQTIAHIFHSKSKTKPAPFQIQANSRVDQIRAYIRNDYECLIILWNDGKDITTTLTLPTQKYTYPVQISLFNFQDLIDVPYKLEGQDKLVIENLKIGSTPVILRLVAEKQL